jgi:DnaJ domain
LGTSTSTQNYSDPDYYAILDIDQNATNEDIKTAYKTLALKWHPEKTTIARGQGIGVQASMRLITFFLKKSACCV